MAARDSADSAGVVSLSDPEERPFGLEDVDLVLEHSLRSAGPTKQQ